MKLPKGFGNIGAMGGLMKQAQDAMARAQNLEKELALEEINVDRGGVKVKYNGIGEVLGVKIDPSLADPNDIEGLEDSILLALREAQVQTGELRKKKMEEITGGLPIPPGLNPF